MPIQQWSTICLSISTAHSYLNNKHKLMLHEAAKFCSKLSPLSPVNSLYSFFHSPFPILTSPCLAPQPLPSPLCNSPSLLWLASLHQPSLWKAAQGREGLLWAKDTRTSAAAGWRTEGEWGRGHSHQDRPAAGKGRCVSLATRPGRCWGETKGWWGTWQVPCNKHSPGFA